MGYFVYNLIIRIYNLLIYIISFFNGKAYKIIRGRRNTFSYLKNSRQPGEKVIWFHCASLGEFEQGRPVMESLKRKKTNFKLFVSFFSSSGYEVKKNDSLLDGVFYLPADTKSNAKKLISILRPEIAIFVKYEFWYHIFHECRENNIPVVSISTILRPGQVFFKFYGSFYRKTLKMIDAFYVQNLQTQKLLHEIGISDVTISGDTRFDRVSEISKRHQQLPLIEKFKQRKKLIILGSTWKPDIDLWNSFINDHGQDYKYIIAPHQIEEDNLNYIERRIYPTKERYSSVNSTIIETYTVLIIDNIGLLSSLYYYGYVNYVGGAFSEGLHNILEPAVFGSPVLFGKHKSNDKYREAVDLLKWQGAIDISNSNELTLTMQKLIYDTSFYRKMSNQAKKYVERNTGATDKIITSLNGYIKI